MFGSFLPGLWLVGTTKVYSGVGADIVMESISLRTASNMVYVAFDSSLFQNQQLLERSTGKSE